MKYQIILLHLHSLLINIINNMMKKSNIFSACLLACLILTSVFYNSCKKEDETDDTTKLLSWGPSPALRGGEMRFIGTNLDKVTAVVLPDNIEITSFKVKTSELLVIDVPEETMPGRVYLKTPQGDITPLTTLGISEPITLDTIVPGVARPGDTVTINGDYLNLIKEVRFSLNKPVNKFISHSKNVIKVKVPDDAQTGSVILSDGESEPITVESRFNFEVTLPKISSMSPIRIKAGSTLMINGSDLDLVKQIIFGGGKYATNFVVNQAGEALSVIVPLDAQDGIIKLLPNSMAEVLSTDMIEMIVPKISSILPNPAKNSGILTITGNDLDLVSSVTFIGDKKGVIQDGVTSGQIQVKVPADATDGEIILKTLANKAVTSPHVTMVKPEITSISPLAAVANQDITITGSNLDIVSSIIFTSPEGTSYTSKVLGATNNQIVVKVAPGSISGKITLVTTNGTKVVSSDELTITPDVPEVTNWPSDAYLTTKLSITGTKLDLATDVIFPGNIKATMFGIKSATLIEVYVPANVPKGLGKIQFFTVNNEVVYSENINFKALGAEEVVDKSLVFFDFDGKDSWWGDIGAVETNSSLSVDGTNYFRVNGGPYSGWKGMFWRNGGNNFPGNVIGTNIDQYSLKFDINIIDPINDPNGVLHIRLKGSEGDFWYMYAPWSSGSFQTTGWITVTVPISAFTDNYGWGSNHITDLSKIDSDFGIAWNNSTAGSNLNILIDNVRFQKNE